MNKQLINFAVTGNPIMHSLSPDLFKFWNQKYSLNLQYKRILSANEHNTMELANLFDINYLNITSPLKSKFFNKTKLRDLSSYLYFSTNFINISENKGFNFDVIGLSSIISKNKINVKEANILILGAGDTSRLIIDYLKQFRNSKITVYNRTVEKAKKLANIKRINYVDKLFKIDDFDIIFSTIPDFNEVIDLTTVVNKLWLIDLNYSVKKIVPANINYINGLHWLIYQAMPVMIMIYGILPNFDETLQYLQNIERKRNNIVLVGFSGTGKTSIGKKLADKLNYTSFDSDEMIESYTNLKIPEIFEKFGEDYFRNLESKFIEFSTGIKKIVISTGGGVVDKSINYNMLQEFNDIIYIYSGLKSSLDRIDMNSRPYLNGKSIDEIETIFNTRKNKYFSICDGIIYNNFDETNAVELLYDNYCQ